MPDIPDELRYLFTTDVLAHVASVAPSGRIGIYVMWIDLDAQGRPIVSSPVGSKKGRNWRANPQVALSVVDHADPWRYVRVSGRVVDIRPDEGLALINHLSRRYVGIDYARTSPREIFTIAPDVVQASRGRGG
jgi:PPOX class probable F420-dependent enzyme